MKKYFLLSFIFLFIGLFLNINNLNVAAEETGNGQAQRWVCLNAENLGSHRAKLTVKAESKPFPNATTYIIECIMIDGKQKCTTGNPADRCEKDGPRGDNCTGTSDIDQQIFGKDVYKELFDNTTYNYRFQAMDPATNPVTTDANGAFDPITWGDTTTKGHGSARKWLAMNFYSPEDAGCDTPGAQQQCTFKFEGVIGKCIEISWDPFGAVFDSKSLEPIKGVSIKLLAKRKNEFVTATEKDGTGVLPNPRLVGADGRFSFLVEEGDYKLEPAAFTFDGDTFNLVANPKLNPDYSKAYSNIYKPDEVIVERTDTDKELKQGFPDPEHRDIPLVSSGKPYKSAGVVVEKTGFQSLDKINNIQYVSGRASHPFAKVCVSTPAYYNAYMAKLQAEKPLVYQKYGGDPDYKCPVPKNSNGEFTLTTVGGEVKTFVLLGVASADNYGEYKLPIDMNLFNTLPNEEKIGFTVEPLVEKADFSKVTPTPKPKSSSLFEKVKNFVHRISLFKDVNAQEKGPPLEVILNYIEGYAYDANGNVIPNAKVAVYLTFSNKPYYETQANEKGFFKVTSDYLPFMPYRLVYTSSGGVLTTTTTTQFIKQNEVYLEEKKINLFTYANEKGERPKVLPTVAQNAALTPAVKERGLGFIGNQIGQNSNTPPAISPPPASSQSAQANMALLILVILIMLIFVGGGLFFYIKKKKLESANPQY